MEYFNIGLALFFIALGFLVKKYPNLIAGYNTMSEEQKKKVDIDGLSSLMRYSLISMGVLISLSNPFLDLLGLQEHGSSMFMGIVLIGTLYMVINAQTFKGKSQNQKRKNIIHTISIFLVFAIVAFLVFMLIYNGIKTPEFTITENQIEITGSYGMTDRVESIELVASIPRIKRKTNGFNYGSTLKGSFDLEEFGQCKLFIQSKDGPYIFVRTTSGTPIIINTKSRSNTEELLGKLKDELEI